MFKQLEPLYPEKDHDLRLLDGQTYAFAEAEMLVPLLASEVAQASREYAIVFTGQAGALPHALTGSKQGHNGYVTPEGLWQARYIPANIRRYPFALGDVTRDKDSTERTMLIMADRAAPHLAAGGSEGKLLYTEARELSTTLANIQQVLVTLYQDAKRTEFLSNQLEELGLLVAKPLHIQGYRSSNKVELAGLRVICPDSFGKLSAGQLYELHKTGALALAHAHFISLSNLSDGLLSVRIDAQTPQEVDMEQLFADEDDELSFSFT